jgi:hypothetical protein
VQHEGKNHKEAVAAAFVLPLTSMVWKNICYIHAMPLKIVRILWGISCLFFLIIFCDGFYQVLKYLELPFFGKPGSQESSLFWISAIMSFWFAAGFLFCLLQNKFRILKWGIAIHLFFTLSYLFAISN